MVYLIPEKPGRKGGMAHVIARHVDVQEELDLRSFEIWIRAEQYLLEARVNRVAEDGDDGATLTGDARIIRHHENVDWYVILDDKAGMAIEYGHGEYQTTQTMSNGHRKTYTVGASEGLFILHRASNLSKRSNKKGRVK